MRRVATIDGASNPSTDYGPWSIRGRKFIMPYASSFCSQHFGTSDCGMVGIISDDRISFADSVNGVEHSPPKFYAPDHVLE